MSEHEQNLNGNNHGDEVSLDFFAQIAGLNQAEVQEGLYEPSPPELPQVELPLEIDDARHTFVPANRMGSPEDLRKELERMRQKYRPFMAKLAPPVENFREKTELNSFFWREETPEDRRNFITVLAGEGKWEDVQIPHYGPPIGEATTLYRKEFELTSEQLEVGAAFVCFRGVDYKAYVFINGYCVGSHEGFFAPFEFHVSPYLHAGKNQLVVRVENSAVFNGNGAWGQDEAGDKIYAATGPGYDEPELGWHHCPPGMGIYQEVYLELRSTLFVSDLFVRPLPDESQAEVWVEIENVTQQSCEIELATSIYGRNFKGVVVEDHWYRPELVPTFGLGDAFQIAKAKAEGRFEKSVPLTMKKGKNLLKFCLPMNDFRWWSPSEPWLYQCQVTLKDGAGKALDTAEQHFGMRSFVMDEEDEPKGGFQLNGQPIRLRGANTMGHEQRCVMNEDWDQLRDDVLLAKIANMNFLRLTQRPVQQEVYEFCDMLGLLTQTDFPLFGVIRNTKYSEVLRQMEEMEKHVRNHPCNILVTYINEPCPQSDNQPHRHLSRPEMEDLFAAGCDRIQHLNPERVIKPCDGDYDPPAPGLQDRHCYPYWYNGHGIDVGKLHRGYWQLSKEGWYHACGEFGAEGLDHEDLMRRRYPAHWLDSNGTDENEWSPSQISWAQTGNFHRFFYDTPTTLSEWVEASQAHQAWATKMMVEAFRRDNRMASFAIHLFIDAFPGGWMKAIMDCERTPKPAYFAYRDALAPLLPSLRTDRRFYFSKQSISLEAWLCNDLPTVDPNWELRYSFEMEGRCVASGSAKASAIPSGSEFQGFLTTPAPQVEKRTEMTCHLGVFDGEGRLLNDGDHQVEVFPSLNGIDGAAVVLGKSDGVASRLCQEMGLRVMEEEASLEEADTIVVDDYSVYDQCREVVDQAVARGTRVVFLNLSAGDYNLLGSKVVCKESEYNPLYFVSRQTSSDLVNGFQVRDFMHWYDPALDRISHLLTTTFQGEDFQPVLLSCNTEKGKWETALAVGEKGYGLGTCIVSQITLTGRTEANPPARLFAQRLLGGFQEGGGEQDNTLFEQASRS